MEVTIRVDTVPAFASGREALGMLKSAMGYLAATDPTQMVTETQAECLQALEQFDAMATAARASVLGRSRPGTGVTRTGITVRGCG